MRRRCDHSSCSNQSSVSNPKHHLHPNIIQMLLLRKMSDRKNEHEHGDARGHDDNCAALIRRKRGEKDYIEEPAFQRSYRRLVLSSGESSLHYFELESAAQKRREKPSIQLNFRSEVSARRARLDIVVIASAQNRKKEKEAQRTKRIKEY